MQILIVGAGKIARHYVDVLETLGHRALVIGRGREKLDELKAQYPGAETHSGGLENWLEKNQPPRYAIIATPIDHLAAATKALLQAGCKNILVEKPLTYRTEEANALAGLAREKEARVHIAFNRRSYVAVQKAKELIEVDGGVSSFHFDFTEASFRIDPANYSEETNLLWGIANSSHVIDTAFFLGGKSAWMECRQYGNAIDWHPAGSIFTGMGETETGVPFTYHANWGCPGKWNIEIMTPNRKLMFSPMERLHQQLKGGFKVELVELDYDRDIDFKPGFYHQVEGFVNDDLGSLMQVDEIIEKIDSINNILNYN